MDAAPHAPAARSALPDPQQKPFLVPSEAAALYRCTERHIYNLAAAGEIPSVRLGRSVRIPTAGFLAVLGL